MKINDYKVEINEKGTGDLFAFRNGEKIFVGEIDITNKNAVQIEENAKHLLQVNGMEIVSVQESIVARDNSLHDRKTDLALVRNEMRKIMKTLGNKDIPLEQKKELLGIYSTLCCAGNLITKTCVVELAYDKMSDNL